MERVAHAAAERVGWGVAWLKRNLRRGRPEAPIGPPIFIVGCGHSGTTLLLAILSAHSRLHAIPFESSLPERSPTHVDQLVARFNRATKRRGKQRWVEKTPSSVRSIGWLLSRFPDAAVIVMRRDGRDVACSLRDRTGDLEAAIRRWLEDNAAADAFVADPRVFALRYEDLVGTPTESLGRLMAFLGEDFEPALLRHEQSGFVFLGRMQGAREAAARLALQQEPPQARSGSAHRSYRSWQARQPVFDGRGRWCDELDDDDKALIKQLAGDALVAYGFAAGDSW